MARCAKANYLKCENVEVRSEKLNTKLQKQERSYSMYYTERQKRKKR